MSEERYLLRGEYEELKDREKLLLFEIKKEQQIFYEAFYRITDLTNLYEPEEDFSSAVEHLKTISKLKSEYVKLKVRLEYLKKKLNI